MVSEKDGNNLFCGRRDGKRDAEMDVEMEDSEGMGGLDTTGRKWRLISSM
jgi:hypothetical protein